MSSLVKFNNRRLHRGKKLYWSRASEDGLPFRGALAPTYTEQEFDERTARVGDPQTDTFDLSDEAQKRAYLQVLDGCVNGWFQCLYVERVIDRADPRRRVVHIDWVEYFMEDGSPAPFVAPGTMEVGHAPPLPPGR